MVEMKHCEFFLLRYVPDAVKDEFVNIGLVLLQRNAKGTEFADVKFTRDWRRVRCLDPQADIDMLEAMEQEIRGQLREMRSRDILLRKLQDSFSNLLQISPAKACLTEEPLREMRVLAQIYFEGAKPVWRGSISARQQIVKTIREAF